MKKNILLFFILLLCIGLYAAPAADKGAKQKITVCVPKAPPALPVLRMIDSQSLGKNVEIELLIWDTPEQLIAMVQDKQNNMFAFPLTVVAKLCNKGLDVCLTNVNTWGVTYFLTSDPAVSTWSDLKDKTIFIPLKSSPPDVLTQFFLKRSGLDLEDVYIRCENWGCQYSSGKFYRQS